MLRFTGHPIADIGAATIVAFCNKSLPEDLTVQDFNAVAEYLAKNYVSGALTPYLSCVFTMNATYTQPSWPQSRRERESRKLLFSFGEPPDSAAAGLRCVFSGEPATRLVYRQHVPMLTGENVLNFFPAGTAGLPVCGPYLLAIQAFPLGARRCLGRALAVHCPDDPELTLSFARRFLADNRKLLLLAERSGEKYADAKAPKTLVVYVLLEIENERRDRRETGPEPSVTAYHLTNSGQGPDIDLFQMPAEVVGFIRAVSRAGTGPTWRAIELAAWQKVPTDGPASKKRKAKLKKGETIEIPPPAKPTTANPEISRNYLYDDLFALPSNAAQFVRTYFLRRAYRYAREDDPRRDYRLSRDLGLVSWELTRLFLKEVIGMEQDRIKAIRTLGDRIATHISEDNDRRLFNGLYRADRYLVLRNLLIKASGARLRKGQPPLIGFEEFLLIFEEAEEAARVDWTLARDLVLIRVIEELYRQEWFGKQPEVLEELGTEAGEEPVRLVS